MRVAFGTRFTALRGRVFMAIALAGRRELDGNAAAAADDDDDDAAAAAADRVGDVEVCGFRERSNDRKPYRCS